MKTYGDQERRRSKRADLTTFCPTMFRQRGKDHKALMQNLSEHGARFWMEICADDPQLAVGDEIDFHIRTPYGESVCRARVMWIDHVDEHCTWGVEFTELAKDEKDPLCCFIDSMF